MTGDLVARFLRQLRTELEAIVDRTLSIANAATFRRKLDHGELVTMLDLTNEQHVAASENRKRLLRWSSAFESFLRRRGAAGAAEINPLSSEIMPCVTLEWSDRGEVPEREWRTKLHRELLRVTAEIGRHLAVCAAEEERRIPHDRMRFTPFLLRIQVCGQRQWQVCAGDFAKERVSDPKGLVLIPVEPSSPERRECFGRALFMRDIRARGNVRIQLDTRQAGALHMLPWELLHDGDQFLGLDQGISLARQAGPTIPAPQRSPQSPLRLLVVVSSVPGTTFLDGEKERELLEAALAPLTMLRLLEIDVVTDSSFTALRRRLRAVASSGRPYDAWHFIGHGGEEHLVMTGDDGQRRDVRGTEMAMLFKEPPLRVVVLNACDGVRFETGGSTSGVAAAFLAGRVPAVVAMQKRVSDDAAILLAEELYGALSEGESIDAALIEARRAIWFQPNRLEWFIPVLLTASE